MVKINVYLVCKIMRGGELHFAISAPRKTDCNKVCTTCAAIKEQDSQAVLETLTAHLRSTKLLERKK